MLDAHGDRPADKIANCLSRTGRALHRQRFGYVGGSVRRRARRRSGLLHQVLQPKGRCRRCQGGNGFVRCVGDDGAVRVADGVAVHDDSHFFQIQHLVFGDSGAGVERGFGTEVAILGGSGDFGDEKQVWRAWIFGPELSGRSPQDNRIRVWRVGGVERLVQVDRHVLIDMILSKNSAKPGAEEAQHVGVQPGFWRLSNQLPADEVEAFPFQKPGGLQGIAISPE